MHQTQTVLAHRKGDLAGIRGNQRREPALRKQSENAGMIARPCNWATSPSPALRDGKADLRVRRNPCAATRAARHLRAQLPLRASIAIARAQPIETSGQVAPSPTVTDASETPAAWHAARVKPSYALDHALRRRWTCAACAASFACTQRPRRKASVII